VTAPGFVVELWSSTDGAEPELSSRVSAETPERAVGWIRLQARPLIGDEPEDAPVWEWVQTGHCADLRELEAGRPVTVAFIVGGERLEWRVLPSAAPEGPSPHDTPSSKGM